MTVEEYREIIRQRIEYLTERIAAKKKIGWEYKYDEELREALQWALRTAAISYERPLFPDTGEEF